MPDERKALQDVMKAIRDRKITNSAMIVPDENDNGVSTDSNLPVETPYEKAVREAKEKAG